jgi:hypothetical protein
VNINDLTPEPQRSVPDYPEPDPVTIVPPSDHGTGSYWPTVDTGKALREATPEESA